MLANLQIQYLQAKAKYEFLELNYRIYLGEYDKIWEGDVEGFRRHEEEGRKKFQLDNTLKNLREAEISLISWAEKNIKWFPGLRFNDKSKESYLNNEKVRNILLSLAMNLNPKQYRNKNYENRKAHLTVSLVSNNGKMRQTKKKE